MWLGGDPLLTLPCVRAQAPGHGEDDYRVCLAHGIITKAGALPCPVDLEGKFTAPIDEPFLGL